MTQALADALVGKFFTVDYPDDNSFRLGQIITIIQPGTYLARFDSPEAKLPLEVVSITEMLQVNREGFKLWFFFDTAEERETYSRWVGTPPASGKIVSLVKPDS